MHRNREADIGGRVSTETKSVTHTPGPWKVGARHPGRIIAPESHTIIAYTTEDDEMPREHEAANAQLIAAAPEMLEALEETAQFLARPSDDAPCHVGITTKEKCGRCSRAARVFAAIAKARGAQ